MSRTIAMLVSVSFFAASAAMAAGSMCKFTDEAKFRMHMEKHVTTYPMTGKMIKEVCKDHPEEFTTAERTCFEKAITDTMEYKNAGMVYAALGMSMTTTK